MGWKRQACLNLGSLLPRWLVNNGLELAESLEMGRWLSDSRYTCKSFFATRECLFKEIARSIENRVVLYLEFGVWQGASMQLWSTLIKHPQSKLHGFDSFVGLPEDWMSGFQKGHFSTNGLLPNVADSRVSFFKGWFHETLPNYALPPHDILVVSIDCDLYLPARYVLDFLAPHFRPGDFVYFDEFHIPRHEVRAFREFRQNNGIVFSLYGATEGFAGAAYNVLDRVPAPDKNNERTPLPELTAF
jgi:hypothetical protein